jgi:hypothetical protein
MDTMLDKISSELFLKNITFDPNNQRVRCLAHVINLAAKKAMENSNSVSYENEMDFIENNDTEKNLKNAIYKVNYYIYLSIYKFN